MSLVLGVSIAAVVVGVAIIALLALVLRGQRTLALSLEEASKNTVAKPDLESLRAELGDVAERAEKLHAGQVERHSAIESCLTDVISSQARMDGELRALRQESKDARTAQAGILLAVQTRTLPDLRPTPVLAHCSFEQVFLEHAVIAPATSDEESDWVKSMLRTLKASHKFKSLSPDQQAKAAAGAELLLTGVAGVFNLAEANKELIAQWAIESVATGGVPITTLAVGLITAPIKGKLGEVGFKVEDLAADGQRSRAASLHATYEALRKIAESPVPENRTTLLGLQRELDEQKHYLRRLVYDKAMKVKDPKLLQQLFRRGRAEAERNAEFDSFSGHMRIYSQLLGLDLITVVILNDPDIARASVIALQEESGRLDRTLEDIQNHWKGTKGYRKELPEPMLLDELRRIASDTHSKAKALEFGKPLLEVRP